MRNRSRCSGPDGELGTQKDLRIEYTRSSNVDGTRVCGVRANIEVLKCTTRVTDT